MVVVISRESKQNMGGYHTVREELETNESEIATDEP